MNRARRRGIIVALALAVLLAAIGAGGARVAWEKRGELLAAAQSIHRQLSQRVDQHDAHLTSLSALVQATTPPPIEALTQVAASIRQFYPRITGIEVIALRGGDAVPLLAVSAAPEIVAAARSAGQAAVLAPTTDGSLLLSKRAGADDENHHAIVLAIDPQRLVSLDQPLPPDAVLTLSLGNRVLVHEGGRETSGTIVFREPLASRSQPLALAVTTLAGPWVPPPIRPVLVVVGLIALAAVAADRLIEATVRAREAARLAERSAQDARLAHAGRVNAMGEMASGIAHELTQPLTAILSQVQGGQRLAQRAELDREQILGAFEAAARNAKRAGDILARLRSWIAKSETTVEPVPLSAVAEDVAGLAKLNGLPAGLGIEVALPSPGPSVLADRTQIEQVVYNLMRNAIEAVELGAGPERVRLSVEEDRQNAMVVVEDNGPGLSAETRARLFEPFYTTKSKGMGLGLALCTTLVERFGGSVTAEDTPLGGAAFRVRLPLAPAALPEARSP